MSQERTTAIIGGRETSGLACLNCCTTYARCTESMLRSAYVGNACCGICGYTDTHAVREAAPKPPPEPLTLPELARGFSMWLNATYPEGLSEEARLWRRITKVCQESGEVHEALGAYFHENPRKPAGPIEDVIKELADCVGAALGAIEDLTGHQGRSLEIATERVREVCQRVGVSTSREAVSP